MDCMEKRGRGGEVCKKTERRRVHWCFRVLEENMYVNVNAVIVCRVRVQLITTMKSMGHRWREKGVIE